MSVFSPFLGKGAAYPFKFSDTTGGVTVASSENYYLGNPTVSTSDLDKINMSINTIMSTPLGTRFFLPEFGCKLNTLVFEPNDEVFSNLARVYIADALSKWEKRLIVRAIDVINTINNLEANTSDIKINYQIIGSQVVGNYVYPFVRGI